MATDFKLVETIEELADSTIEFYSKPEFYKEVLRSYPKYFVHINEDNKHKFGLSKFCAFKDITVEEYIATHRYQIGGGTTQKHIARLTGEKWIERKKLDNKTKGAFDKWINDFFPNYSVNSASFITLSPKAFIKKEHKKFVSPKDFLEDLKIQNEIGKVGEDIALEYEFRRLKENGIQNPHSCIEHVAIKNIAAGYDIYSSTKKETRYIEVKSCLNKDQSFFITENELQTLSTLDDEAFLYLVHISNLESKIGKVYKVYRNPIQKLRRQGTLKPIIYRAQF